MGKNSLPRKLLENIEPGEEILYYTKKMPSLEKPKWLIVTTRRVIYFDEKILGRYDLISIPYGKIEKIYFVKGIASTDFIIKLEEGKEVRLGWMKKNEGVKVMEAINEAISRIAVEAPTIMKRKSLTKEEFILVKPKETIVRGVSVPGYSVYSETNKVVDPYEELLKLKKLREEGIISDEEYEELRKRIIEKLGIK